LAFPEARSFSGFFALFSGHFDDAWLSVAIASCHLVSMKFRGFRPSVATSAGNLSFSQKFCPVGVVFWHLPISRWMKDKITSSNHIPGLFEKTESTTTAPIRRKTGNVTVSITCIEAAKFPRTCVRIKVNDRARVKPLAQSGQYQAGLR